MGNEAITILSYDLLTKFNLHRKFHCAIADESHFIKNGKYLLFNLSLSNDEDEFLAQDIFPKEGQKLKLVMHDCLYYLQLYNRT